MIPDWFAPTTNLRTVERHRKDSLNAASIRETVLEAKPLGYDDWVPVPLRRTFWSAAKMWPRDWPPETIDSVQWTEDGLVCLFHDELVPFEDLGRYFSWRGLLRGPTCRWEILRLQRIHC